MPKEHAIQCRHHVNRDAIERVKRLLRTLPSEAGDVLERFGITSDDYELAFQSAVQSIRGTFAATMASKRRFHEALFEHMRREGQIRSWAFVGTGRSQDYRVTLSPGYEVGIEAKGCPDGNNIRIWTRPSWAREFVIWSQCTDSLEHDPGHGIVSGISRLYRKALIEGQHVDAFIFFDGRCGTGVRQCPKSFGATGALRSRATDFSGQEGREWIPPPCIYLFPPTVPHALSNPNPAPHDPMSCRFAGALLTAFGVPVQEQRSQVHWARCQLSQRTEGVYRRLSLGWGLENATPTFETGWQKISSE